MSLRTFYKSSPRLRRAWRLLKNHLTYWPARFTVAFLRLLPLPIALRFSESVGALLYRLMPSVRRLSHEHLRLAFGTELSAARREQIARQSLVNVARSFCEIAKFDTLPLDEYVELDLPDVIGETMSLGRGTIAITGHIGNWELLAAYFARRGHDVYAVARRIYDERVNQMLLDFRSRSGVKSILREDASSARQILRALNHKALLAMVIDQDTHAPSLSVPFFGRPARTPVAPATLALRRDIPVVAAFIHRRPQGGYLISVRRPFAISPSGDRLEDLRSLVTQFNRVLEEEIRAHPEEWVWWHERWRRGPIENLDLDSDAALRHSTGEESQPLGKAVGTP